MDGRLIRLAIVLTRQDFHFFRWIGNQSSHSPTDQIFSFMKASYGGVFLFFSFGTGESIKLYIATAFLASPSNRWLTFLFPAHTSGLFVRYQCFSNWAGGTWLGLSIYTYRIVDMVVWVVRVRRFAWARYQMYLAMRSWEKGSKEGLRFRVDCGSQAGFGFVTRKRGKRRWKLDCGVLCILFLLLLPYFCLSGLALLRLALVCR